MSAHQGLWSERANKLNVFFTRHLYTKTGERVVAFPFSAGFDWKKSPMTNTYDDMIDYGICYDSLHEVPETMPEFCD